MGKDSGGDVILCMMQLAGQSPLSLSSSLNPPHLPPSAPPTPHIAMPHRAPEARQERSDGVVKVHVGELHGVHVAVHDLRGGGHSEGEGI